MVDQLIQLIAVISSKITDESDMIRTHYEAAASLRTELAAYIHQLQTGDRTCLRHLATLFSPTGSFQEHAIANGWVAGYFLLSSRFDGLYADLKEK